MSDLDGTTISIDELRAGYASDLLAEADVVIAVDVTADEEEVIYGRHAWDLSTATGYEEDLVILRVELDMEAGDLEWLVDTIEAIERGEINADGDSPDIDEDDEV